MTYIDRAWARMERDEAQKSVADLVLEAQQAARDEAIAEAYRQAYGDTDLAPYQAEGR